ncbi:hypothetical protein [Labilibaculum sp.]|uniref:hypothetical protein n=1 Tax=Labilibaculum sp. TaxID=2060723 RepID=UPI002AA803DF|nr:hypothetical protein [Labilibaculum sp.]MBN2596394.1 hypothetical protein [Marinifilaceae bacterium]
MKRKDIKPLTVFLLSFSIFIGTACYSNKINTLATSNLASYYVGKQLEEGYGPAGGIYGGVVGGMLGASGGGTIGAWVGGAIGSAFGPAGTVLGVWGGEIVGSYVGGA